MPDSDSECQVPIVDPISDPIVDPIRDIIVDPLTGQSEDIGATTWTNQPGA